MTKTLYGHHAVEYARLVGGSMTPYSPRADGGGFFTSHEEAFQVAKYSPLDVRLQVDTDHPDHEQLMAQLPLIA